MDYLKLNNGMEIPTLGIGTFRIKSKDAEPAVEEALKLGYRLVDTANVYQNEVAVGKGIKNSGVPREEIFLTSKIWPQDFKERKVKKAIKKTLKRLDTDYVDLILLHQEAGNYVSAWKGLEKEVEKGTVKAIGVSNFSEKALKKILKKGKIKPVVAQNESHPYCQEDKTAKLLEKNGIVLEAWYPLGSGDKKLMNEKVFKKLAEKYGKSTAQVILRWHTQVGHVVIPGSKTPAHIADNLDIFDFTLTDDELKKIAKLDKGKKYMRIPKLFKKFFALSRINFDKQK